MRASLKSLGFEERIRGSHQQFVRDGVEELMDLQEVEGGKRKRYQVKQMREVLLKYNLIRKS